MALDEEQVGKLCCDLQQTFDSIQDGFIVTALGDLRFICESLGHPIHDKQAPSWDNQ